MHAIQITTLEGPEALRLVEIPAPVPNATQVLISVKAAGVAFPEVLQSRGLYQLKPPLPFVPGAEIAGDVIQAPLNSGFTPGDRVAALSILGGFAERAVAEVSNTFKLPDSVSYKAGAAYIFNYGTAYFGLIERGRLQPGERVLVHGAAGGIGTASVQVAKAFGAGRVIAVTSAPHKGAAAVEAGADEYVLAEGFRETISKSGGVNIVVDPVGGERFTDSLRSLVDDGRLLVIGFTAGEIPTVRVNRLLLNNISVVGVGWGAYVFKRPGHIRREWDALLPHLVRGALAPVLGQSFALSDASQALKVIEERKAIGKVTLTI